MIAYSKASKGIEHSLAVLDYVYAGKPRTKQSITDLRYQAVRRVARHVGVHHTTIQRQFRHIANKKENYTGEEVDAMEYLIRKWLLDRDPLDGVK